MLKDKTCTICLLTQPATNFNKRTLKSGKLSLFPWCKSCRKVKNIENRETKSKYYSSNKTKIINDRLIRKFGITSNDYKRMLQNQNGVCSIYKNPESRMDPRTSKVRSLAVDHCHNTGKIRGLLCTNCNQALGLFKDSIESLYKAVEYLKNAS
jgi:predicted transcriptional regulator YheO